MYHHLLLLMQYNAITTYVCATCERTVSVSSPPCPSFGASLQSIKEKLHTLPLLTQVCSIMMYPVCVCTLASYNKLFISLSFALSMACCTYPQLPVGQGRLFRGVVDLVQMQVLLWEQDQDGSHYSRMPYSQDLQLGLDVDPMQARRDLVEQVSTALLCSHFLLFSLNCKSNLVGTRVRARACTQVYVHKCMCLCA